MSNRTRTQITIYTRQRIVVRSLPDSFKAWCEQCGDVVAAVTVGSCEGILQITAGDFQGLLDSGKLHVVEPGTGAAMVCCNSLSGHSTETEILIEGERQ